MPRCAALVQKPLACQRIDVLICVLTVGVQGGIASRQEDTPILEAISPDGESASSGDAEPNAHAGQGAAEDGGAAHAALILGGPYTSDVQVLFCPALRWASGVDSERLSVRWSRREPGTTAWLPVAGATGWEYHPCAADADAELRVVVRQDSAPEQAAEAARIARQERLAGGVGEGLAGRVWCEAVSPPLRAEPLAVAQVEKWLVRSPLSCHVVYQPCANRLTGLATADSNRTAEGRSRSP